MCVMWRWWTASIHQTQVTQSVWDDLQWPSYFPLSHSGEETGGSASGAQTVCSFRKRRQKVEQVTGPVKSIKQQRTPGERSKHKNWNSSARLRSVSCPWASKEDKASRRQAARCETTVSAIFFLPPSIVLAHERCWLDAARANRPVAGTDKGTERWKQISQWNERPGRSCATIGGNKSSRFTVWKD